MKLAYTLHRIGMGKGVTADPKQVVEMPKKTYDELARFGAVRAPSEDESALYRLSNPLPETAKPKTATNARADLLARAAALDLEFHSNIKTTKLSELVEAAESEADNLLGS